MSSFDVEAGLPSPAATSRPASRFGGLAVPAALACTAGQLAFVGMRAAAPAAAPQQPHLLSPSAAEGAAQAGATMSSSSTAAAVLAAGAAAALLATRRRDETRTAMASGHDRRTFRGKLHNHSFGKYRLRKTKARRLKNIRDGTIDLENIPQHGQPEPEHVWDMDNVLNNRLFYVPEFVRDAYDAVHEDYLEVQRENWKSLMGKKGPQDAFKNWSPEGGAKDEPVEVAAALVATKSGAAAVKALRDRSRAGILDCKKALAENDGDMEKAMAWLKKKGIAKADKKAGNIAAEGNISSYVHFNNKIAVLAEINSETDFVASNAIFKEFTQDIAMQIAANPAVVAVSADDVPADVKEKAKALEMQKEDLAGKPEQIKEKIVAGRLSKQFDEMALMSQKWLKDEDKTVEQVLKETIAKLGENIIIRRFVRLNLGEGLEKKDDDFAAGVEKELAKYRNEGGAAPEPAKEAPKEEAPKEEKKEEPKEEKKEAVKISAAMVKELRERSGAGILDSKKALTECGGDTEKAMEWLKKKGIAKADKKAGNVSAEGTIASYVHFNQKIGVIVEVNSETDFVAINAIFKEFAADVAMQIAANPSITCITTDDVPADIVEAAKKAEMEKEDLAGKPEQIKEKIVAGRLKKQFEDMALMGQKWLKDEDKTVEQVLKEKIAKLGENLIIRRFERLTLGEGLEKKDDDFAAGVEKELAKYRTEAPKEEEAAEPVAEAPAAEEPKAEEPKEEKPAEPVAEAAAPAPAAPKAEEPKKEMKVVEKPVSWGDAFA